MSKRSERLRALVTERLTAAAGEIFALVERTIAEYEEELCGFKEENHRKQQMLDQVLSSRVQLQGPDVQIHCSPELSLKQEILETPQIKEEPEEQSCVKQEEETVPQFTETSPKTDNIVITKVLSLCDIGETHNHSAEETVEQMDNSCDTDNKDDLEPPPNTSTAQMETEADGDHYKQVQIKDIHNSALFTKHRSASKTSATVTDGHMPGTGAEKRKKHECTNYKKRFMTKSQLIIHTNTHKIEKSHSCPICQKEFAYRSALRAHERIHTGMKLHSCPVCEKTFALKGNLKTHMRTHTGERPYICSTCKRTFAYRSVLREHETTHTGEKPFSCMVCEKMFAKKGNLFQHMKTHSGEKPYSCSVCMKTFTQKAHLGAHMRTHTRKKPHSCTVCKKAYLHKRSLNQHVKTHTGEKPYSCVICNKNFARKDYLDKHISTHKKETLQLPLLGQFYPKDFS